MSAALAIDDPARLRLRWVLGLRWAGFLCQLVVIAITGALTDFFFGAVAIVVVGAASNVLLQGWSRPARRRSARFAEVTLGVAVVVDLALLTALLAMTGGPLNPFTLLYMVHVATVAVALPRSAAIGVTVAAIGAYGVLFLPGVFDPEQHMHLMHGPGFAAHVRGMWIAFAITAAFVVLFVGRLRRTLDEHEVRREELRALDERGRRFAALATLAGGAAHELASPLQSISVIADGLARRLAGAPVPASCLDDTALLQAEVRRCKDVLSQLAADAGTPGGEPPSRIALRDLAADAAAGLDRVVVVVEDAGFAVDGPRRALTLAVRGLIKNALLADAGAVRVVVEGSDLVVVDHGHGMTPQVLARAGEPFFTTRETGAGMGLGLFLARTVVEAVGATLTMTSSPGQGTIARIAFAPAAAPIGAAR